MTSRTSSEMRISTCRTPAEARAACPELSSAVATASFFETLDWFETLLKYGLPGGDATMLTVAREGVGATVLPLRRVGMHLESASNFYTSLFGPIGTLPAEELAPAFARWIADSGIAMLRIQPVAQDSRLWQLLDAELSAKGFFIHRYFSFGNWYLPCAGLSWRDYLADRPSQLRNTILRKAKRLQSQPGFSLRVITGEEGLDKGIADFIAVYGRSWKKAEPFPDFIPAMCRMAARKGWLRLGVLELDGTPVSAQLWIVKDRIASIYKLAYDEDNAKEGVGTVLSAALFEHALDVDQVMEIDFLTGDDPHKALWMSHRRERQGIEYYNMRHPFGILGGLLCRIKNRIKEAGTPLPAEISTLRPAVVIGLCGHGLAICRALKRHGVPVHALEADRNLPGFVTRTAHVHQCAALQGEALVVALQRLARELGGDGKPVLIATNDNMVRELAHYRDRLEPLYDVPWFHCIEKLVPLLDKRSIRARCAAAGLNFPHEEQVTTDEDFERVVQTMDIPAIIKPAKPLSRFKVFIVRSREELRARLASVRDAWPVLVQTYVEGSEDRIRFAALYLRHGKVVAEFQGKKLRSRPTGHTTLAVSEPNAEVAALGRQFFDGLDLSGPVSLELKQDPQGRYWVIEPTVGRTDFWVDLCTMNGVPLPMIEYRDLCAYAHPYYVQTKTRAWSYEIRDPLGSLALLLRPRYLTRLPEFVFLRLSDYRPALRACSIMFFNLMGALRRRIPFARG